MNSSTHTLSEISKDELHDTTGGAGWVKPAAKFVGKKVLGPVGTVWSAYEGVKSFKKARDDGKSVGRSLFEGAKEAVF